MSHHEQWEEYVTASEEIQDLRHENEQLRHALTLLLDECKLAGLSDASDYGWPKAYAAAQTALKRPS